MLTTPEPVAYPCPEHCQTAAAQMGALSACLRRGEEALLRCLLVIATDYTRAGLIAVPRQPGDFRPLLETGGWALPLSVFQNYPGDLGIAAQPQDKCVQVGQGWLPIVS